MERRDFILKLSYLLALPLLPLGSIISCSNDEKVIALEVVLGKKIEDIYNNNQDKKFGNSLFSFVEKKNQKIKIFNFAITTSSLFLIIQNGKIEKISISVTDELLKNFQKHLKSLGVKKENEITKNEWGKENQILMNNTMLNITLCDNDSAENNQIILESKNFRNFF